ncbi:SGNH/GDSL hydrolase family protein [Actinomadura harenae]|uniref:SGNH/GDSL hydrolase family protein n=1 Tax=Actinomadura harenae TaxID=2483351 RepID=A0A3M2MFA7_9ACTN|nr:SGNH/GDSL hydrolase family protein [Actinomadura harenae]RMI47700.1 SGNH/GDSL hydrolase family protein [Actinomadura harenae]
MRTLATALALTITATAPLPAIAADHALAADHATAAGLRYTALGDSFVAGPLIPTQHGLLGCLRSDHNYPSLVATSLGATLTDASCTGAETTDITHRQVTPTGHNAPQIDSVHRDTDLVTLGIGGNDVGFSRVLIRCAAVSLTSPMGAPCSGHYHGALDKRIKKTAPKVASILRRIHTRAPHARVLVVGYPRLLPDATGCWPKVPFAAGDVSFLNTTERHMNAMLAKTAAANNATFVDTYSGTEGHDVCAPTGSRWVEGVLPTHTAAPAHPNQAGMQQIATRVRSAFNAARNT